MRLNIPRHIVIPTNFERNLVYQDLQKCGCTFMRRVIINHFYNAVYKGGVHQWTNYNILESEEFSTSFRFTFFRDPLDRALSCFKEKIRLKQIDNENSNFINGVSKSISRFGFKSEDSFVDFSKRLLDIEDEELDNHIKPMNLLLTFNKTIEPPQLIISLNDIDKFLAYIDKLIFNGIKNTSEEIFKNKKSCNVTEEQKCLKEKPSIDQIEEAKYYINKKYHSDYLFVEKYSSNLDSAKKIFEAFLCKNRKV